MALRTHVRLTHSAHRNLPKNLLRLAIAAALSAAALPLRRRRNARGARRHRRHRHPRRHRERDRDQARIDEHRRGGLGRGHRQAPRHQHRGIHLPPAGPHLAARGRPRVGHQPARHGPGLHDGPHERPRAGEHRRQPQRRVRPVPLRAPERRRRLQDAGLAARGQGLAGTIDLRTIRPLDYGKYAMAVNFRAEQNSNDNLGANSDDSGYRASFSFVDQFMDGEIRHRLRLRAPRHADGDARLRHLRAVESIGRRRPARLPGRHCGRLPQQPGRRARPVRDQRHEGPRGHGLDGARRLHGDAAVRAGGGYSSILDLYYSTMDQTDNARSLEVNLGGYPAPCCVAGSVPGRHGLRLLGHDDRARHGRRRHAQHRHAARPQLPVHDGRRNHGGRLAQRVPDERRLVARRRHQLLQGDA